MDIVEWMGPPLVKIFFLLFKTQWKEFLLAVFKTPSVKKFTGGSQLINMKNIIYTSL
jgi:hypothetical protein